MNKRGLSDVITTVLIILLVLAAVAIIWAFLQPAIKRSISQVTGECLTLNLKPVSCTYNSATNVPFVKVTRDAGKATLKEVILLFEIPGGDEVKMIVGSNLPEELETKTYESDILTDSLDNAVNPVSVRVGAKISIDEGGEKICDPSAAKISCTAI